MTCSAICVDPKRVDNLWQFVRPLIHRAMCIHGRRLAFDELERDVLAGSALVWLAWDGTEIIAAAVTELQVIYGRKVCSITACSGRDRERWLHLLTDIENFARREGCAVTRIDGREGWKRVLPDYHVRAVILEKDLV